MSEEQDESPSNPDIHFEPIVRLPLVETQTLEEDEEDLVRLRAKLFRYDCLEKEWKERGTGEVKILKHRLTGYVRVVMRRDKTLKICANHYVDPSMELKPNCNSDRAWIWSTLADYSDEKPKAELLAIRFANAENAQKFKDSFEEAKQYVLALESNLNGEDRPPEDEEDSDEEEEKKEVEESEEVAEKLKGLNVNENSEADEKKDPESGDVREKKVETKEAESGSTTTEESKPSCKTKLEEPAPS